MCTGVILANKVRLISAHTDCVNMQTSKQVVKNLIK